VRRLAIVAAWLAFAAARAPADPAPWSSAFAADTDTVVFYAADGGLVRAPFNLAAPDTLWAPRAGEHVVRARVSPDGRGVAWITRAAGQDSASLWAVRDSVPRRIARFMPVDPMAYSMLHHEAVLPSVEEIGVRGGRFVQPDDRMHQPASYTLEWTPDGRAVMFGHASGLSAAAANAGPTFPVSNALALSITALHPSPVLAFRAIALRSEVHEIDVRGEPATPVVQHADPSLNAPEFTYLDPGHGRAARSGRPQQAGYLLYPLPHRWRFFPGEGLDPAESWTASRAAVWWISAGRIHGVRSDDPRDRVLTPTGRSATWLGYDAAREALLFVAGGVLQSMPESGGAARPLMAVHGLTRAAFASAGDRYVAIVGDSLGVWDTARAAATLLALGGLSPVALFEASDGALIAVTRTRGASPGLARVDLASRRLVPVTTPALRNGVVAASPGRGYLLLYDPIPRGTVPVQAYDVAADRWTEVANPGIIGWDERPPR
jgi:hypothetical protein